MVAAVASAAASAACFALSFLQCDSTRVRIGAGSVAGVCFQHQLYRQPGLVHFQVLCSICTERKGQRHQRRGSGGVATVVSATACRALGASAVL